MKRLSPAAKRRSVAAATLLAVAALAFAASASGASVTIGQTLPNSTGCGEAWFVQTSPAGYAVPAGDWRVTDWSTAAGGDGGTMSLMIFRPTGAGQYTVVGESPQEPLTANALNTFTLATPIAVQGGDLLGMYEKFADCGVFGGAGMIVGEFGAEPPQGAVVTPTQTNSAFLSNIAATLSPAMPTTRDDCKQGGWQSFGVFKNQGDCVSWVATGGKNAPAGG